MIRPQVTDPLRPDSSVARRWLEWFESPPVEYRPVPFWSWNERMEPGEVARQLRLMAEAGLGGGFIHSRVGLTTPYLGEAWFEAVAATIAAARESGLKVWLYDEDKWPSGYSGGTVPLADERYRTTWLLARPADAPPPTDAQPVGPAAHGLQVYLQREPLGNSWFNGASYVNTLSDEAVACFRRHAYETYHARFAEAFGSLIVAQFTDEPAPFSVHGISPRGVIAYTPELDEAFADRFGYDPRPLLHLLFIDGPGAPRFRLHYHQIVNELFERHFVAALGSWCAKQGIALTGHLLLEGDLYRQQEVGYLVMPHYRAMQWPGIDHLGLQIDERISAKQCHSVVNQFSKPRMLSEMFGCAGQRFSFADRWWIACQQIALGVNLICPHLALYTMAGRRKRDYPPNLFYQQPWWPMNRVIDDRLSRLCVAMSQGRYHAEMLLLHPGRSAAALWRADAQADTAQEPMTWFHHHRHADPAAKEQITRLEGWFKAVVDRLLSDQRTFDLGDETILASQGRVEVSPCGEAALHVGAMRYRVVVMPPMATIAATTLDLLERFTEAGGIVRRIAPSPHWLDGEPSGRLDRWLEQVPVVDLEDLTARLAAQMRPAAVIQTQDAAAKSCTFVHLRDLAENERLVFLVNLHRLDTLRSTVRLSGDWTQAQRMDPATGTASPLPHERTEDAIRLDVTLAPTEAMLLRLTRQPSHPESPACHCAGAAIRSSEALPAAAWSVRALDDNAWPLDTAYWREGDGAWSARAVPVLAIQKRLTDLQYQGPVTLRYEFHVDPAAVGRRVRLVTELAHLGTTQVNGHRVQDTGLAAWRDIRWRPLEITDRLVAGRNTIEHRLDRFLGLDSELEAVYLVGDFAVQTHVADRLYEPPGGAGTGLPPLRINRLAGDSLLLCQPQAPRIGDITTQGWPFYAGRLEYRCAVDPPGWTDGDRRWRVTLEELDATVLEVAADGQVIGHLFAPPYQLEIPARYRTRPTTLTLTHYNSLRNLLGPHHDPVGETYSVGPDGFLPRLSSPSAWPALVERWAGGADHPSDWHPTYAVTSFGDTGSIRLVQTD